ncbi:MAG: AmmeMemoRadiSam system protein B [Candidatus Woesearchaeota archaeon]
MRLPIATKTHYSSDPQFLQKQIEDLFIGDRGPGALPVKNVTNTPLQALIVAHASYEVAGPCMAWAYNELAQQHVKEPLYVLIGCAQNSTGAGTTLQTFQLPMGEVRPDQEFLKALVAKEHIAINDELHAQESLLEVQIPFIQYVHGEEKKHIKIAPLLVTPQTNLKELALDIKETLIEQNKQATFIVVNNFTQYGREFKYVPFTEDVPKHILDIDSQLFSSLKNFDHEEFTRVLQKTLVPISSQSAVDMLFSLISPQQVLVEQAYLSGDVTGDYKNTVSFASIVFK